MQIMYDSKVGVHLCDCNGKHLHKHVPQANTSNIIHHINSNEFDNRPENLIEITVSNEERRHFGDQYNSFTKHFNIHEIFNSEFNIKHFENTI